MPVSARGNRCGWRSAEDAHSSVGKALHVIGAGRSVVESPGHRLTGEALEAALQADPDPADVVAVVATAGTTNAGIVDDLAGVAEVCQRRGLWFHVDAAYGGAALLSKSQRSGRFSPGRSTPIRS